MTEKQVPIITRVALITSIEQYTSSEPIDISALIASYNSDAR
jgi:hypothetical protein